MEKFSILIIYISTVNLIAFCLMGIDKYKAKHHQFRIPEVTLFFIPLIGGCIGALLGMSFFRHKTKHKRFTIGLPLILVLQLCIIAYYFIL